MSKKQEAKAKHANKRSLEAQNKGESIVVPKGSIAMESDDGFDVDEDTFTLEVNVTRETLEGTPVQTLTFLKAIGTSAAIRASMAGRGYRAQDHTEGWNLLQAVSGYQVNDAPFEDTSVRDAIQQIDDWDEVGFHIIAVTLKYRYPEQASFLLSGLKPATGAAAVLGVKALLDRLDVLEFGNGREATREKDQAAMAILAQRGIGIQQRQHLRTLLSVAESAPAISVPDAETVGISEAEYLNKLTALRAWFEEWSGIARVAIKRRDYLICLGLARRHPKATDDGKAEPAADKAGAVG